MEILDKFTRILIRRESIDSPVAQRVLELAPERVEIVNQDPFQSQRGPLSAQAFKESKRQLLITPFRGEFFKRCPGARPGLVCCNYFVLNLGQQCDMDCSYCYLQSFLNYPAMVIYSNIDQAIEELQEMHLEMGGQSVRIGTGEVIDSLSLDPISLYSRSLIEAFREFPNWTLEFKTKSARVDQFLDLPHAGNVWVSFSINPENIVAKEEHQTASLAERLGAARRAADRGFPLAFHIDPMIWHEGWQESYAKLVSTVTEMFSPSEVKVLSLGALRFQPEQKQLMRERFGMQSLVTRAEMWPSGDGKLRYDRRLRSQMFDFVLSRFRSASASWKVFLCMESHETWLAIDHRLPHKQESLKELFDPAVVHRHRQFAREGELCSRSQNSIEA